MPRLFTQLTATPLQATTYLLGIALFSISFLVFLNATISFVVTDVIGQREHVGDAVGTLGFADELLALVACPLWGLLSDRIGVRMVAVAGYCIVGLSLICLVQSENVYPELLVGRLGFSLGGAACSTMVTAVLPAMVARKAENTSRDEAGAEDHNEQANGHATRLRDEERPGRTGSVGHATSGSISSELTMTQHRYASGSQSRQRDPESAEDLGKIKPETAAGTSQLAGLVGLFTGAGALVALAIFLPLPAHFQNGGQSRPQSVQTSFYIVGAIAFCVAIFIFLGLRNLPGESDKSFANLWSRPYDESSRTEDDGTVHITLTPAPSYLRLIKESVLLGFTDPAIGLGYLGGFVARASSVGISLFIPLFVNAYFVRNGLCTSNPDDLTDIKENCKRAYTLASALTGIAETAALICAPLFGYLGGRVIKGRSEWPLLGAAVVGISGYVGFGFLRNPDAFHGDGGQWAFLAVILIGISQIGSIVCSLGLLSRGINAGPAKPLASDHAPTGDDTLQASETDLLAGEEVAPLLPSVSAKSGGSFYVPKDLERSQLKGSIAGVYSFAGGAGILLLTKLGGALFDSWTVGAPFFLLAIFNAILFVAIVIVGGAQVALRKKERREPEPEPDTGVE
ncbi:MFS/sugar transport protein [Teratosphaeria destructans]|uniref:MFS/sugar transport protein n=1 Tax=Teratosphaeria destructans TaxID=418781 RepID=A0A9W7SLT2_9PEZI|nr:MFS/sugar transport protein [Teratosphaeria destructans]